MRFKNIILITLTFLIMGCDGSYESNKDEMVTELKTYDNDTSDNDTSACSSSGCMFVTVGNSGTILTSSDGTSWTSRTSGTSNNLQGVTFGNSTFVVAGNNILTSSDGTSWTLKTSGTSNDLEGVTYSE